MKLFHQLTLVVSILTFTHTNLFCMKHENEKYKEKTPLIKKDSTKNPTEQNGKESFIIKKFNIIHGLKHVTSLPDILKIIEEAKTVEAKENKL